MRTVCAALAVAASFVVLPAVPAHAACNVTVDLPNFSPATLHVTPGTTVTWCWASGNHSVTGTGFDSDVRDSGATFTHAFATAGTYAYHCKIHDTMQATVVVEGTSPSPTHTPKPVPTTRPPAATTPPPTRAAATTPPPTRATTAPTTGPAATPAARATRTPSAAATSVPPTTDPPAAATTPLAGDPKPGRGLPAVPLAIGAAVLFGGAVLFTLRRSGPTERTPR